MKTTGDGGARGVSSMGNPHVGNLSIGTGGGPERFRLVIRALCLLLCGVMVVGLASCLSTGQKKSSATPLLDDIVATKADSGKTWSFFKGSTFTVKLEGNPTTGYEWTLLPSSENDLVMKEIEAPRYEAAKTQLVGSGGTYVFTFMAANPGRAKLVFGYARSWEKLPPLETVTFTLDVKDVH